MLCQNEKNAEGEFIFPTPIKKYACAYLSLLTSFYENFLLKTEPDAEYIMYHWIEENASLGEDRDLSLTTEVLDWQGLSDSILGKGKVLFLGRALPAGANPTDPKIFKLTKWIHPTMGGHFTYKDYDPWVGGSPVRLKGKVEGYRYFKVLV